MKGTGMTAIRSSVAHASLRSAVRTALRLGTGIIAAGIAVGAPLSAEAEPFPPELELSALFPLFGGDGSLGFAVKGSQAYDALGISMSDLGDVNGDGLDDVIIGAPGSSTPNSRYAGRSFVLYGRDTAKVGAFPAELLVGKILGGDGSYGFAIDGATEKQLAGYSVSAAGDVNGDGVPDMVIGATNHTYDRAGEDARVFVIFGHSASDAPFPAVFPLAGLLPSHGGDGSAGFVMSGLPRGMQFGKSVSGAGDVNGDGVDDLIMSAPLNHFVGGAVFVVFGRDTTAGAHFPARLRLTRLLPDNGGDGSEGFILTSDLSGDLSLVSGGGDVNGDGIDDLVISHPLITSPSSGAVAYVLFGRDSHARRFPPVFSVSELEDGDGSKGFAIAIDPSECTGSSLSLAGDVNGDGIDDLLIGDPCVSVNAWVEGRTYVVFGRSAQEPFPGVFDLGEILSGDGSEGFVLNGAADLDFSGSAVNNAGDVNGDGIEDMLVGAPQSAGYPFYGGPGDAYVIFGRDTPRSGNFPPAIELADLFANHGGDGSVGVVMHGGWPSYQKSTGSALSTARDVNGDGVDDMLIGAAFSIDYAAIPGVAYVVFGRAASP